MVQDTMQQPKMSMFVKTKHLKTTFTQKRVGHTDKLNGKMYVCGLEASKRLMFNDIEIKLYSEFL